MSIITPTGLLTFLQLHGYLIMFIIMILEGAIVTYVSAFIASIGVFNIYIVFGLSILGNVVGDIVAYLVGKHWGKKVLVKHFYNKMKGEKIKKIETLIKKNPGRTIALVKISPIIPIPGLILIGASEVPLKTFLFYSAITSIAYSSVFTILGFYSGVAFSSIAKYVGHSDMIIGVAILFGIGVWFLIKYISNKITKKRGI